MPAAKKLSISPRGPFALANAQEYFGGWPTNAAGDIVMAFPVEGWKTSAAVVMRQDGKSIEGEVHGAGRWAQRAWSQALATVSLDANGAGFAKVARSDPVLGKLWVDHRRLRPVLFHSPYEAACAFVIGHRITIAQTRRIRQQMAEKHGTAIDVGGETFHAFPDPLRLRAVKSFPGVAANKVDRLHVIAREALNGRLDRQYLRGLPEDRALAELKQLPGVGDFFAQGILSRGAGLTDFVSDDDLTPRAVQLAYGLNQRPGRFEVLKCAEAWRPYRMWAVVLLHVWLRRQPKSVIGPRQLGRRPPRSARAKA